MCMCMLSSRLWYCTFVTSFNVCMSIFVMSNLEISRFDMQRDLLTRAGNRRLVLYPGVLKFQDLICGGIY